MLLGMKKGSATTNQSKRRTNNTLMLFSSSRYHEQRKLSMEKCSLCGGEERLIGCVCERCLVRDRRPPEKTVRILVVPMESFR